MHSNDKGDDMNSMTELGKAWKVREGKKKYKSRFVTARRGDPYRHGR